MARSRPREKELSSPRPTSWCVLTTPWIEVMDLQGRPVKLSPLGVLQGAASLHRIALPNPLDVFAVHRFLLTLLYWQADTAGGVKNTRTSLLAGVPPKSIIDELIAEADCFNLFDSSHPFLQDPEVQNAKVLSASSLFAEMASGTNVSHFHHADDDTARLCIECAILGLLRLVPWTQSGGAGKQPSLHGAPPIMALAMGATLSETLGLNLVPLDAPLGKPQWSGQFIPPGRKGGISVLEALTWNPRRVHLLKQQPPALCSQCGDRTRNTVGPIVYEKNPACKQPDEYMATWKDPAAFYKAGDRRTAKTTNEADAALGNDLRRICAQHFGRNIEPAPLAIVGNANATHTDWLVVMPCTNPANNKSYDHRAERLPALGEEASKPRPHWHDRHTWQAGDARAVRALDDRGTKPTNGVMSFLGAAARLDDASWSVLANAANRSMDEDPAAFDIFTGLLWPLRNKQGNLPSRPAAWMALKLMATAGAGRPRSSRKLGDYKPWMEIRRSSSPVKEKSYPRSVPPRRLLEAELREIIRKRLAQHPNSRIDWPGLCQFLHEVIR